MSNDSSHHSLKASHIGGDYVTLKEYVDTRLISLDEATRVRADALEKRFESVNEFRKTLSDQAASFATRSEVKTEIEKIGVTLDTLKEYKNKLEGKASMSSMLLLALVTLINLLIAVIALVKDFVK